MLARARARVAAAHSIEEEGVMSGWVGERKVLESRWATRSCDCCGEAIMLGEHVTRVLIEGQPAELCPSCGSDPTATARVAKGRRGGMRRAA
jgi:hypothetical protein